MTRGSTPDYRPEASGPPPNELDHRYQPVNQPSEQQFQDAEEHELDPMDKMLADTFPASDPPPGPAIAGGTVDCSAAEQRRKDNAPS